MDLRILTDIAAEILTTDEVCQFIKLEDQDDGPELLLVEQMISSVRTHFERRTGLSFAPRTYEAFFRRSESPFILPVAPVISVDKVETIDYLGTKTEQTLNEGYYKKGLYEVEITPIEGYDILVTFQAGYGNTNTQNLPEDLRHAMLMQILRWYDNRDDFYELKFMGSVEKILHTHKTRLI